MYEIDLEPTKPPRPPHRLGTTIVNNILADSTKQQLIKYYHAACFSPVQSTWIKAIKRGAFKSWHGLTVDAVKKHFTKAMSTTLGHMHQTRQGIRSTQPTIDETSLVHRQEERTNHVYMAIVHPQDPKGNIYTDLCGRFPILSSRGNQYIFVLYDYDSNAILARAMKNRTDKEMSRVFSELADTLADRGFKPQYHFLDNECSAALKREITKQSITYQLAPPGMHRQNNAERAIQTFKNHFVAGLCTVDTSFPLQLWCRMLQQATVTLNLLRPSRLHPPTVCPLPHCRQI
jgi:hypothetical protein